MTQAEGPARNGARRADPGSAEPQRIGPQRGDPQRAGARRVDPEKSACLLIGVNDYRHDTMERLDSVEHNLRRLRDVLTDPDIGGFPDERVQVLPNPVAARDVTVAIEVAGRLAAEDTLIVYYAGHGVREGEDNRLFLTLPGTERGQPETCVDTMYVRKAINRSPAPRTVLILDCCYSAQWARDSRMSGGESGADLAARSVRDLKGLYLMASSPHNRASHAPDPDRCSVFTGALVDVLEQGDPDPGAGEAVTLKDIYQRVRTRVEEWVAEQDRSDAAAPLCTDENGLGEYAFVRNAARRPVQAPPPAPVPPPKRGRLAIGIAIGLVLGLTAGFGIPYLQDRLDEPPPKPHEEARGPCSGRAALLDHSDALDKTEVDNEPVAGLSGLAYAPDESRLAYAVADNDAVRIFPIRFGSPDALAPQAQRARTLRAAGGGPLGGWFDAEAVAVEKDGGTALVAGETEPTIRRFDLRTGRQKGEPLPIPEAFEIYPKGAATAGRTIEAMALSPSDKYLFVAVEAPLAGDGDERGRNLMRIQRYERRADGTFAPDAQFAYRGDEGLGLADLVAVSDTRLLALERQYVAGLGNSVHVKDLSLAEAQDVTGKKQLYRAPADVFIAGRPLFDLARCPEGSPGEVSGAGNPQSNELLDNVEGMTLGDSIKSGPYKGRRHLLLVSDDNRNKAQTTRLYSFAVRL
ncbi:esterase-like activity of phytase family protein [Streptomyces sp. NPDC102364]|uniref:caspase, EACC1-associated type n=1 Tax=Streptomyces sp. NPDC102364 TaxID=3366161 RepID=UPI0037FC2FAD